MPGLDHFGLLAPWYDKLITYNDVDEIKKIAALPAAGNLLDIGGGTGRVASSLVGLIDKIVVVDISFEMLKIARGKGLSAICALGEVLPYPSKSFSRALIVDALHHCINQKEVLSDVWRVLQTGGLLVIIEPNYDHSAGKVIRLFEKLILMKSHFLSDSSIVSLIADFTDNVRVQHYKGNSWFMVKKSK